MRRPRGFYRWRPIAEAPDDCQILTYGPSGVRMATRAMSGFVTIPGNHRIEPTHFMRVAPPEAGEP